jgi:hypothetical protein
MRTFTGPPFLRRATVRLAHALGAQEIGTGEKAGKPE